MWPITAKVNFDLGLYHALKGYQTSSGYITVEDIYRFAPKVRRLYSRIIIKFNLMWPSIPKIQYDLDLDHELQTFGETQTAFYSEHNPPCNVCM